MNIEDMNYETNVTEPELAEPNVMEEEPELAWNESRRQELKKSTWAGFGLGVLVSVVVVAAVVIGILIALKSSGQIWVLAGNGVHEVEKNELLDDETVDKLSEIYEWMSVYYYEDFDVEDIRQALYDAVIGGLGDKYSVYYTEEEYKDLMVSTTGTYYGIGAGLSQNINTMEVTVTKVYRGTPAEEAGLKDGDKILAVGDIEATSMELTALVQKIRGEEGTKVRMKIYRASTDETLELDVERRNVVLPSVEGEMLENQIAYIQITEFQSKTDEQFRQMVEDFKKQGMKGLIVDVRANPGGLLRSVADLCDYILPEGLITYVEDAFGNKTPYRSDANCLDVPMVVLMDENSASASEIFAGAMKDYKYATLVGTTTYGKGIVQNVIGLSDGDAIKLTTSKYFTPLGNYIHGVGITPDVELEYEYSGPTDQPYDKQYDNQFQKALEIMKEKLNNEK